MGIFGDLLGKSDAPVELNRQEAFIGIMVGLSAADGHISSEEINELIIFTEKTKLLKDMSSESFKRVIDKVFKILRKDGLDRLMELAAKGLGREDRLPMFVISCDLVFADGVVEPEEEAMIERLKEQLGVDNEFAQKTIEVISVKNRI